MVKREEVQVEKCRTEQYCPSSGFLRVPSCPSWLTFFEPTKATRYTKETSERGTNQRFLLHVHRYRKRCNAVAHHSQVAQAGLDVSRYIEIG